MDKTISNSTDKFYTLFEHSADAHLIFEEHGITDCNQATVKLLKCRSKNDVLSLHPAVLSPEFQPDGRRSLEKAQEMDALARKNGYHRFEWIHKKMDGEEFPVEVTVNAVEIDGKTMMIVLWHDLTEIKRSQRQIRDLNERMQKELQAAADLQRSLLPTASPYSDKFKSSWVYQPCEELGGDSLNIFRIDDSRIGLYVLDVTGHGAAAALLSVTATHFLSGIYKNACPKDVAEGLNRHFSEKIYKNHTFTLVYGIMDFKDSSFTYTSAGHIGPIRMNQKGLIEQFDGHGPPIGMFDDAEYGQANIPFSKGERLFLVSDGVYEARNSSAEELGFDGTRRHFMVQSASPLESVVNSLAQAVYDWCIPNKPTDDISIVGFEIR